MTHSHLLHTSLSPKAMDEIIVLHSIYDTHLTQISSMPLPAVPCPDCCSTPDPHYSLVLPLLKTNLPTHLYPHIHFSLPALYPTSNPPTIRFPYLPMWTGDHVLHTASAKLDQLWTEFGHDVVCFEFFDWLAEFLDLNLPTANTPKPIQSKKDSVHIQSESAGLPNLSVPPTNYINRLFSHTEPIIDRKSIFLAHGAFIANGTRDPNDLHAYMMRHKRIARSTHNIIAFRVLDPHSQSFIGDCDDDGEKGAGKRLLHLLERAHVENVWVMVSRWYGGIQLGPSRFSHINQAALQVLVNMGVLESKHAI